jgi:hypothetical protein
MFARRETLVQALNDLETGSLPNAETIIAGRRWWIYPMERTGIEPVTPWLAKPTKKVPRFYKLLNLRAVLGIGVVVQERIHL